MLNKNLLLLAVDDVEHVLLVLLELLDPLFNYLVVGSLQDQLLISGVLNLTGPGCDLKAILAQIPDFRHLVDLELVIFIKVNFVRVWLVHYNDAK